MIFLAESQSCFGPMPPVGMAEPYLSTLFVASAANEKKTARPVHEAVQQNADFLKMTDAFKDIEKLEADLWEAADNLRANSKLTSSDYFMPVLGVIFLRHAANRFEAARRQIEEDQAAARCPSARYSRLTTSPPGPLAAGDRPVRLDHRTSRPQRQ